MDRLHLEVFDTVKDGKTRHVTRLTNDHGGSPIEIFHEFDRLMPWSGDAPLDGYVLVVLLFAASTGKSLRVHGPLTRSAMRNMEELLLAWSRWKPARYRRIDIVPDRVLDVRPGAGPGAAIAAFSGGIDATFTALRHAADYGSLPEATRYGLRSVLMVHGFDVDIYNLRDFERLVERTRPLIKALELDLRIVRTNSRDLRLQDWDDSSALELAGCLHMHADKFQYGLLGSTKSYDALVLPWGSNPVTDHLMSGDRLAVVHDGAGFSRTDKAAEILRHPVACRTVKVCYAGIDQSENCGRCEKCVRSQLNFLAAGATMVPRCFPRQFDLDCVRTMAIDHEAQMVEHASLVAHAKAHNVWGPWLPILEERLAQWRPVATPELARQKAGGPIKRSIAKSLTFLGINEPAKKVWRPARRVALKATFDLKQLTTNFTSRRDVDRLKDHIKSAVSIAQESVNSTVPTTAVNLDARSERR